MSSSSSDSEEDTARVLLSDYYGLQGAEAGGGKAGDAPSSAAAAEANEFSDDEEKEDGGKAEERRARKAAKKADSNSPTDLSSTAFEADAYVGSLLQRKGMRDLVELDTEMRASVRSLDSDMQMLVYENYNKFISATDVIRKMKDNVGGMEREMNDLLANMERISSSCETLESQLTPNRARVEKLVGVSRLIKRLEFLFELPVRLKQSIEMGANAQAVLYYTKADKVLRRYQHHVSFKKIRSESEEIMVGLKAALRKKVRDVTTRPMEQMETSALLIQLGDEPSLLLGDIFSTRGARLQEELRETAEAARKAEAEEEVEEEAGDGGGAAAGAVEEPAGEEKADAGKKEGEEEGRDGADKDDKNKSKSNSPASLPGSPLVDALSGSFLESFCLFSESFHQTFVEPFRKNSAPESQKSVATCSEALATFTRGLFAELFGLVRQELVRLGTVGDDVSGAAEVERRLGRFTRSLGDFYRAMARPAELVPGAGLTGRAEDVARYAVRHCAEGIFDRSRRAILAHLLRVHENMAAEAAGRPRPAFRAPGGGGGGGGGHRPRRHKDLPDIGGSNEAVHLVSEELELGVSALVPVLYTRDYLPELRALSAGGELTDLAHRLFQENLRALASALLCGTARESDGPVHESVPRTPEALVPAVDSPEAQPRFFLAMADVCMRLQEADVDAAFKYLKRRFPLPSAARTKSADLEVSRVVALVRENADMLLGRYVEAHGRRLGRALSGTCSTDPGTVAAFYRAVDDMRRELAVAFPGKPVVPSGAGGGSAAGAGGAGAAAPPSASPARPGARAAAPAHARRASTQQARELTLKRDMERLFTKSVDIFGPVKRNRASPLLGALKIAFKQLVESIRARPGVSLQEYQMLHSNVQNTRRQLPPELGADQHSALDQLLEEALSSASDRCAQSTGAGRGH